jgi:hypothetical protein
VYILRLCGDISLENLYIKIRRTRTNYVSI